jgi:hypothetical protein
MRYIYSKIMFHNGGGGGSNNNLFFYFISIYLTYKTHIQGKRK